MSQSSWLKRFARFLPARRQLKRQEFFRALQVQTLETRDLLAADFGDAPSPYPTLAAENGPSHLINGLSLGTSNTAKADGTHSANAAADASDDGVTFGTIRVGALKALVTVNVQGGPAKLDAWIDFNRDGSWGGPGEKIFSSVSVVTGDNLLAFDVPSDSIDGTTYARFRISNAGNLGISGPAADGEVEDYAVTINPPTAGTGAFLNDKTISTGINLPTSVIAADVDGDGDMDALLASSSNDTISWYENDGNANFTSHILATSTNLSGDIRAVDLDGDGDLDVLAANDGGSVAWYENDGNQNFSSHVVSTAANASKVFAADMDGDGDLDVLTASGGRVAWYANDGAQGFTVHVISTSMPTAFSVFAADMDGDGDLDVAAAGYYGDINWFENDGSQSFTTHVVAPQVIPTSYSYATGTNLIATDVDGDGDIDIMSASAPADTVAFYDNDGNQNFSKRVISTASLGAASIFAADIEGDGDTDILTSSVGVYAVRLYKNNGSQTFAFNSLPGSLTSATSAVAADIDGDGDLDILYASQDDHKIGWYPQNSPPAIIQNTLSVIEGERVTLSTADLNATDSEGAATLTYSISSVSGGQFELVTAAGVAITSFTQAQIDAGSVQFVHDGGESTPAYTLIVSDGQLSSPPSTVLTTFAPVNDAPVITTNTISLGEGGLALLRSYFVNTTDPDNSPEELTYTASDIVHGQFELVSNPGVAVTSFTQAQVNAGQIVFFHDESEIAPSFTLVVTDGLETSASSIAIVNFTNVDNAQPFDFGDAPAPYATLLSETGASHRIGGPLRLGSTSISELDGTHSDHADAEADDDATIFTTMYVGAGAAVFVDVQGIGGKLDAWIDFNGDGTWTADEQIADSLDVAVGSNYVPIQVPINSIVGTTFARFRVSSLGNLAPTGPALDGEVEDHEVNILDSRHATLTLDPVVAVDEGSSTTLTGSVSGLAPLNGFRLDVDWGLPGETNQVNLVSDSSGNATFSFSHTYSHDGTYPATVNLLETGIIAGTDFVLVIDTSNSTQAVFGGTPVGDVNNDGIADTRLDAEIAALLALNQNLIDSGLGTVGRVSVIAFNTSVTTLDLDPVMPGIQSTVSPLADADHNGILDVTQALQQLAFDGLTFYKDALDAVIQTVQSAGTPMDGGSVIFVSDGDPSFLGRPTQQQIDTIRLTLGQNLRAFGVGPDATLTYLSQMDPAAKLFSNSDEVLAAFNDRGGASETATTSIQVNNIAPSNLSIDLSPEVAGATTLTGSFTDEGTPEAHTVAIQWGDGNSEQVTLAPGNFSFNVPHQYVANGSFTVIVSVADDAGDATDPQTANLDVISIPSSIMLNPVSAINEGGTATLSGTVSHLLPGNSYTLDLDWGSPGDTQQVSVTGDAAGNAAFSVSHLFPQDGSYTVSANLGTISTATTTVQVTNVLSVVSYSTQKLGISPYTYIVTAVFSDPGTQDDHSVTFNWGDGYVQQFNHVSPGGYTSGHSYSANGDYTLTISVTDDDATSIATTILSEDSLPPTVVNRSLDVTEGTTTVLSTSNLLSTYYSPFIPVLYNTVAVTGGRFELTSNPGVAITQFSQDQVNSGDVVFAHDGGESAPLITLAVKTANYAAANQFDMLVTFTNVNDAPVIFTNSMSIAEGAVLVLDSSNINTIDPDNNLGELNYTAIGVVGGQFELVAAPGTAITSFTQAEINAGAVQFVHDGGELVPSFDLVVNDGAIDSPVSSANVVFTNVNDSPTVAVPIADVTVNEDSVDRVVDLSGVFSDVDSSLTYSAISSDGSLVTTTVSGSTLTLSFPSNANGTANVTVTADDGSLTVSDTFTVTVNAVNDPPIVDALLPDISTTANSASQIVDLSNYFSDVDSSLTYTAVSSNGVVVITSVSGSLLTLDFPSAGSSTITVTATDGANSVSDSFEVTVVGSNRPPVLTSSGDVSVDEGSVVTASGTWSDPDNNVVTLTASAGQIVQNSDGTWTWTYGPGDGPDDSQSVTITAVDENNAAATTTFALTVNNVAPAITAVISSAATIEDAVGDGEVEISGSFVDPGRDSHTVTVDWGDGTVETVAVDEGSHTFSGSHVYADGGLYKISTSISDSDGANGPAVLTAQAFVQGIGLIDGTLYLIGTDGRDHVQVRYDSRHDEIDVDMMLDLQGRGQRGCRGHHGRRYDVRIQRSFDASAIDRIVVFLGKGDDFYDGEVGNSWDEHDRGCRHGNHRRDAISQIVFGGDGDDEIFTGIGNDFVDGGAGRDNIHSDDGHDILIGGIGRDLVKGGGGNDLLIGGSLEADWEHNVDLSAIDAALAEWASGDLADTMDILGSVVDDEERDDLFGDSGHDTFITGRYDRRS